MTNAERTIYQIDQILFAYGAKRAPYRNASDAVMAIKDLVGPNCQMCAFLGKGCEDDEGLKCNEGVRLWLEEQEGVHV